MINLKLLVFFSFLAACASFTNATEVGPKYPSSTLKIGQHHEFVQKNKAPDFWALMPHYAAQKDESACGIASITMLVNAAKNNQALTREDKLVTQNSLLTQVKIDYSKGLTLRQLSKAAQEALKNFGIKATIELIHANDTHQFENKLKELLKKNEESDNDFILANFNQAVYTDDIQEYGHISPVMAFDSKNLRVLIADVDREYYEPYWVSFRTFLKGLRTTDPVSKENRGFIYIKLDK